MSLALALVASLACAAPPQDEGPKPIRRAAAAESRPDTPAPDFELADLEGEPFRLSARVRDGYLLLVFVRGMW